MYFIYLRKSRKDMELEAHGEMETLARHEAILLDLAKRQSLPIGKIYKELVSGETIAARPVMQQILDEVEEGIWEGGLVMEVERLARGDTIDQGIVARAFKKHSTKIVTPNKTYDPSDEFDEEFFEFGLFMSRREYRTINRRIQRGRLQSVKDGRYIASTPPYGYDRVKIQDGKGYTLSPNEQEAPIVQQIFAWYLEGAGCEVIAKRLDTQGVPTRTGRKWSKATLQDMLKNPTYIGKIRWSYRVPIKEITDRDARKTNPEPIVVDGLHPPLISAEIFEQVQQRLQSKATPATRSDLSLQNPLSGIVRCGKCGALMTRLGPNSHTPYATLKCSNRYCDTVASPLYQVEGEIVKQTRDYLKSITLSKSKKNKAAKSSADKTQKTALLSVDRAITQVQQQISTAYDLLEQGVYTVDVFTSRQSTLSEKLQALQSQKKELEEKQSRIADEKERIRFAESFLDGLTVYDIINAEEKNRLLRSILQGVVYTKDAPNKRGMRDVITFHLDIYHNL